MIVKEHTHTHTHTYIGSGEMKCFICKKMDKHWRLPYNVRTSMVYTGLYNVC